MPEVHSVYVMIARPMGENDAGRIETGHYVVENDEVTLTDQNGKPLASGRMQTGYSAKLSNGLSAEQAAKQLLWRKYKATKSGSDFNRTIVFPREGWR